MVQRISVFLACLLVALSVLAGPASAQDDPRQTRIAGWNATLNQIEASLRRTDLSDDALDQLRSGAQSVLSAATDVKQSLAPELSAIQAQLQSLAPPEAGGTEAEIITTTRSQTQAQLDAVSSLSQQADVAALRAGQLIAAVAERRSGRFAAELFTHEQSILLPSLWGEIAGEAPAVLARGARVFSDWFSLITSRSDHITGILAAAALVLIGLVLLARARFLRWAGRGPAGAPTSARRDLTAAAIVAVDVGVPLLTIIAVRILLAELGILPPSIDRFLIGLTIAVGLFTLITGLARAFLAPARPDWRVFPVADATAIAIYSLIAIGAFLVALLPVVDALAAITAAPDSFVAAVGGILSLAAAVCILLVARTAVRGRALLDETSRGPGLFWRWLTPLIALAAAVAIASDLIGYLALARFVVEQIARVWVVLGLFALAVGLLDPLVATLFSSQRPIGLGMSRNLGFGQRTLSQVGVVVSGLVRLLLVVIAFVLIAAPWGFDSTSLASGLDALFYGVRIGSLTITVSAILTALAVFAIGIALSRIFQHWLDARFLPTTAVDPGLKNSIHTGVGYLGIILAAILAATYSGLDLANIAIVAGALSVGIGFGLQSIVNNFVSGLILLAERPIRTGDWIVVGTEEGTVKRISVRATEIETFDRASVIIPNSNLISGVVRNMYLRDNSGRIIIAIGVGYESDPEAVRDILLDCARKHRLVVANPEPQVLFMDFGPSSLDFELHCYLADISQGGAVRSDLRYTILKRLREAGIEIPFPQHDVNLRDWSRFEEAMNRLAGSGGSRDTDPA